MKHSYLLTCAALVAVHGAAGAQSLDALVRTMGSGVGTVSYPARSGVCGDGRDMIRSGEVIVSSTSFYGRGSLEPGSVCNVGPAHAELTVVNGAIIRVRPYVGGPVTGKDLGAVEAGDAAQAFFRVATTADGPAARGALNAAAIADVPDAAAGFLEIERHTASSPDTRAHAIFWYAALAGEAGAPALADIAQNETTHQLREAALAGLSESQAGVTALLSMTRSSANAGRQREATFWLGQTKDVRAAARLVEIARDTKLEDELRGTAIFALGESGAPNARETLISLHSAVHGTGAEEKLMQAMGQQHAAGGEWLMSMALNADEPEEVRKQALFWATESDVPTSELVSAWGKLDGNQELQRHLLFLYGQRGDSAAVNKLISVAKTDPSHSLQKEAIFWLSQVHDRRATQTITDILK